MTEYQDLNKWIESQILLNSSFESMIKDLWIRIEKLEKANVGPQPTNHKEL